MRRTKEFDLAVACCRWPQLPETDEAVRRLAEAVDWPLFLRVVRRHRVEGLAHHALQRSGAEVPADPASALAAGAAAIARQNLFQAAEAARLGAALDGAGIAHLFVKGVTLAVLAYGSLTLKGAVDIDVLVDPERYADACSVLRASGYRCTHPGDRPVEAIVRYADERKDSIWRSDALGSTVELHQRLTENPGLLPRLSALSPRQTIAIAPAILLPTLARDELFAYLCVHGALTAWARLKWLADLAALIGEEDEAGVERLARRAAEIAPGRAVAQALLLCRRLFDIPLAPAFLSELRRDPLTRYLERAALATMLQGNGVREVSEQPFGTARMNLASLFLQPGLRYKAAEARRKLPRIPAALRAAIGAARAS